MKWALITTWTLALLPAAARAIGLLMVAPVFSHKAVPVRLRVFLGLVMGLAVAAGAGASMNPSGPVELAFILTLEVLVGVAIGYAAQLVFVGVQIGALHVGRQMGIDLGGALDPSNSDASSPVVRLFGMLMIVIFISIGGCQDMIIAMMRSFQAAPPATLAGTTQLLTSVVMLLTVSFDVALRVAAPVLVAMLLATAAMGMLQRAVPQCNILSTGLPIRAMLGLVILAGSLAALTPVVTAAWNGISEQLLTWTSI